MDYGNIIFAMILLFILGVALSRYGGVGRILLKVIRAIKSLFGNLQNGSFQSLAVIGWRRYR